MYAIVVDSISTRWNKLLYFPRCGYKIKHAKFGERGERSVLTPGFPCLHMQGMIQHVYLDDIKKYQNIIGQNLLFFRLMRI